MAGVLHATLLAIENERNKLDTLFLHMTDGVVAFDHEGHLIHCNPAANALLQQTVAPDCTYEDCWETCIPLSRFWLCSSPTMWRMSCGWGTNAGGISCAVFLSGAGRCFDRSA